MTWCARCDVLTTVSVGEPCPACGVPALDAAPVSGKARSPIQVLELEEAPIIHIAAADAETGEPINIEPPPHRGAALSRLRGRPRLIAVALTAALIGVVYLGTRPALRSRSKATPTATPSTSPALGPVLGEPANGWAVFAFEHHFTLIDLPTGAEHRIEIDGLDHRLLTIAEGRAHRIHRRGACSLPDDRPRRGTRHAGHRSQQLLGGPPTATRSSSDALRRTDAGRNGCASS